MNAIRYTVQIMNNKQKENTATLEILQAIENESDLTQRNLADRLGVALGLANSYLKRCVHKGLVKIHQAPANRYFYYLTPKGFAEKSRLTAEYLSSSFDFYRKAGDSYCKVFQQIQQQKLNRVMFCGISELAEIASLKVYDYGIQHVASYENGSELKEFLGKPVLNSLSNTTGIDAFVLTSFVSTNEIYQELIREVNEANVFTPDILGLNL